MTHEETQESSRNPMFESVTLKPHLSVNDEEMLPPMKSVWALLVETVEIKITLYGSGFRKPNRESERQRLLRPPLNASQQ